MTRRSWVIGVGAAAIAAAAFVAALPSGAAEQEPKLKSPGWSFTGMMGTYNTPALQRGYQVFADICSGCHSLKYVAYRNLAEIGFPESKIKAIAAAKEVTDGPNDQGEMFQRPAIAADRFVAPFPNENAARAAMNGALPPDLSLIVKAREGGADYVYSILTGFGEAPATLTLAPGMNFNEYFPGHQIAMPPPLSDDGVTYADGTKATVDQMARDVVQFLEWAAEPRMEDRKRMGLGVMIFLVLMAGVLFAVKARVWSGVEH